MPAGGGCLRRRHALPAPVLPGPRADAGGRRRTPSSPPPTARSSPSPRPPRPRPERAARLSIFMSVFNCHVNRSPFDGRLSDYAYVRGRKAAAFAEKASIENEQNRITLVDAARAASPSSRSRARSRGGSSSIPRVGDEVRARPADRPDQVRLARRPLPARRRRGPRHARATSSRPAGSAIARWAQGGLRWPRCRASASRGASSSSRRSSPSATCSAATSRSGRSIRGTFELAAVPDHRRGDPRRARRPDRPDDALDLGVRRGVRLARRPRLLRRGSRGAGVFLGPRGLPSPRLDGIVPLRRLRLDAPGALQHPDARGGQALLRRPSDPRGGRARSRRSCSRRPSASCPASGWAACSA